MGKINLLKPDVRTVYLAEGKGQEVTYLNVDPDLTEIKLSEDINNGAVFLKEVYDLAKRKRHRVVVIKCQNREEGLEAVSYLASIYNDYEGISRDIEDFNDTSESRDVEYEDFESPDNYEDFDNHDDDSYEEWKDQDVWEENPWKIPILEYGTISSESGGSFNNPFYNSGMGFGRAADKDSRTPYWKSLRKETICVEFNIGTFQANYYFSSAVFKRFKKNRHIFVLIVDRFSKYDTDTEDDKNTESTEDDWGWESDHYSVSSNDEQITYFVLEQSADIVSIHHKKESLAEYYKNLFESWVDYHGCSLIKDFPLDTITKKIVRMDNPDKSEMIDKVISYVIKDFESPRELTTDDFNVLNKLRGLGFSKKLEKEEKHKSIDRLERSLVGIDNIKDDINGIVETFKYNKRRVSLGLKNGGYHNVHMMLGAPGTAKTTVAKILGDIMVEEHLLDNNRFISINGAELKGMFVGHSAPKVKALFEDYEIIFIDEAYAIAAKNNGESDSFSQEAISQLIIELENHGMDRLVIFAGYGGPNVSDQDNKMLDFLKCNPGIRSRINSTIVFESYNADQMLDIFKKQAKMSQYRIPKAADKYVLEFFSERAKEEDFGNGREARSLLENATVQAAKRISKVPDKKVTKQMLQQLTVNDICKAIERMRKAQQSQKGAKKRSLGFQM